MILHTMELPTELVINDVTADTLNCTVCTGIAQRVRTIERTVASTTTIIIIDTVAVAIIIVVTEGRSVVCLTNRRQ